MSNAGSAVRRAVKAAIQEMARPLEFQVGGRQVTCSQCGGRGFKWHGYGMMGTRFKPIIEGYALECSGCSHLEFFARRPEEL